MAIQFQQINETTIGIDNFLAVATTVKEMLPVRDRFDLYLKSWDGLRAVTLRDDMWAGLSNGTSARLHEGSQLWATPRRR